MIYEWDPYNASIITEEAGRVRYKDLIPNITYREVHDEQTGHMSKVVVDSKDKTKSPTIEIVSNEGKVLKSYSIPTKAQIRVEDNDEVGIGSPLVKIPRDLGRMRDITGGLPRVTELFEARSPQSPAVITDIDGIISFDKPKRGQKVVAVTSLDEKTKMEYMVSVGKYILVQEGDFVRAGDRLTEGSINPHILRIKGANTVQEYLVNEIQVYRMQNCEKINKHIEVIVHKCFKNQELLIQAIQLSRNDHVDRIRLW